TLVDPQTKEMALRITYFKEGDQFKSLAKYNYFSMLLLSKGKGSVQRDEAKYTFSSGCLLCFAIYEPFRVAPEDELEGVLINFHPAFFCLFKHRNEVSCNGVLFNNLYDTPEVPLSPGEMQSLSTIAGQLAAELRDRQQPDPDALISYLKVFLINATRTKIGQ